MKFLQDSNTKVFWCSDALSWFTNIKRELDMELKEIIKSHSVTSSKAIDNLLGMTAWWTQIQSGAPFAVGLK
jgi:hypothetical protein